MHAYLIYGRDEESIESEIQTIIKNKNANLINFSIEKVDEIRTLNGFLHLAQQKNTFVIIKGVDNISTESANAFLKSLEEPNKNVSFILVAGNLYKVIPTIISRCQIIKSLNKKLHLARNNTQNFINLKLGEKLEFIDKLKKREEAIHFIEELMFSLHEKLVSNSKSQKYFVRYIETAQNTLDSLYASGNVTIQLTNMVVKLDNSPSIRDKDTV